MSYASPKKKKIGLTKKYIYIFTSHSTTEQNAKYRKLAILVERSSASQCWAPDTSVELASEGDTQVTTLQG